MLYFANCLANVRNLRYSGITAKSTPTSRSALVGSKNVTDHEACNSSCFNCKPGTFASNNGLYSASTFPLSWKSAFVSSGRSGRANTATTRGSRTRRSSRLNSNWCSSSDSRKFRNSAPSSFSPPYSTVMFSVARRRISFVNSLSSLMYFSLLPFLIRYSGGCATKTCPRVISSCICRKKKVNNNVRIWEPSTSASVIMMIL